MLPYMRSPNTGKDMDGEDGEPRWCAQEMILPQQLIDVLQRDARELDESDDETGEQEHVVDSDTDSLSDDD